MEQGAAISIAIPWAVSCSRSRWSWNASRTNSWRVWLTLPTNRERHLPAGDHGCIIHHPSLASPSKLRGWESSSDNLNIRIMHLSWMHKHCADASYASWHRLIHACANNCQPCLHQQRYPNPVRWPQNWHAICISGIALSSFKPAASMIRHCKSRMPRPRTRQRMSTDTRAGRSVLAPGPLCTATVVNTWFKASPSSAVHS